MKKKLPSIKKDLFKMMFHMFLTFATVFTFLFGYLLFQYSRVEIYKATEELAKSIGQNVNQMAADASRSIKIISDNIAVELATLSQETEGTERLMSVFFNSDDNQMIPHLLTYLEQHEDIEKIEILDDQGTVKLVLPYDKTEIGKDLSQYVFFDEEDHSVLWSDLFVSENTNRNNLMISLRKNSFTVLLYLDLNEIDAMLKAISSDSDIVIHDRSGNVIACTEEYSEVGTNHAQASYIKKALNGEMVTGKFVCETAQSKKTVLGTTMPISNGWVVTVFKSTDEVYFFFFIMGIIFIVSLIGIFVASSFAIKYFSRTLVKPLDSLVKWSEKMARGQYDEAFEFDSYEEVEKLVRAFKIMSVKVETRESILNENNKALKISEKEANQANKAKSEFLANMSHEFRTPLNGILGFSQILNSTSLDSEQQSYLNNVIHSSRHLMNLVTDVLDFSKIEAGRLELEREVINLRELLEKNYNIMKPASEAKQLQLKLITDPDLPPVVEVDSMRLSQVLINLLNNAVKFTEAGTIQLSVRTISIDEVSARLRFEVSDTGIGIPEEKQASVFEMFTQVDSSVTRKYGGTGLGLSISNQILELMDSKINLISQPGKGSCFFFDLTLPIVSPDEYVLQNDENKLNRACMQAEMKILIVEDDIISSKLVKTIINRHFPNATVIQSYDGIDAVEKYHLHQPEIVLMDMHLPGKSGLEAVREIRKGSSSDSVYIIALSADARRSSIDEAHLMGFDYYMTKPVEKSILIENICKGLEKRKRSS